MQADPLTLKAETVGLTVAASVEPLEGGENMDPNAQQVAPMEHQASTSAADPGACEMADGHESSLEVDARLEAYIRRKSEIKEAIRKHGSSYFMPQVFPNHLIPC